VRHPAGRLALASQQSRAPARYHWAAFQRSELAADTPGATRELSETEMETDVEGPGASSGPTNIRVLLVRDEGARGPRVHLVDVQGHVHGIELGLERALRRIPPSGHRQSATPPARR
jgi:hypothetical protein